MSNSRRTFLKGMGGLLALPLLDAEATPRKAPPLRFLVVGNALGMHPAHFFPSKFGKKTDLPKTLESLNWLQDRLTILSHTDHNMKSGHGREVSFLSGVLPENSGAFAEKNISIDQLIARQVGGQVRFASIHTALERGIRMCWNANGVELKPITDPHRLFNHLFLNRNAKEKRQQRELIHRNTSILDAVRSQFNEVKQKVGRDDQKQLDQFANSVRDLENSLDGRKKWIDRDKPKFDISDHFAGNQITIENRYNANFDMIGYAFQTDQTRVATIAFPTALSYKDIEGVTRGYHACTHNGKKEDVVDELVAIESFQISQLSRCLKKLDALKEPGTNGTLLDHTIVLFGSGMGYGGTHSNRNLPILVAGGGFKHRGHVDARGGKASNMPLCNLYVTLMQRFGIERDKFNTSTGAFELNHA